MSVRHAAEIALAFGELDRAEVLLWSDAWNSPYAADSWLSAVRQLELADERIVALERELLARPAVVERQLTTLTPEQRMEAEAALAQVRGRNVVTVRSPHL